MSFSASSLGTALESTMLSSAVKEPPPAPPVAAAWLTLIMSAYAILSLKSSFFSATACASLSLFLAALLGDCLPGETDLEPLLLADDLTEVYVPDMT
jgi:hypothetical protein